MSDLRGPPDVCEYIRQVAPRHRSLKTLAESVHEALGIELSISALRSRYDRWRARTNAPGLKGLLASGPASDFADEPTMPGAVPPLAYATLDQLIAEDGMRMLREAENEALARAFPMAAPDDLATNLRRAPLVDETNPFLAIKTDVLKYPKEVLRSRIPPQTPLIVPWEHGDPPARVTFDSDNHVPHHDERFMAAKLELLADLKPDLHINLGDHYDFEGVSDYAHDPGSGSFSLQEEFDASREYWTEVCKSARDVEFILGNHEDRLYRTVIANPGFYQLRVLDDWHSLAGIPEKVRIHPFNTQRQIGLCWCEHGHEIPGDNPTHTAIALRGGRYLFSGHTHRHGMYSRTVRLEDGRVVRREAWNIGFGGKRPHRAPHIARWAKTVPHWTNCFAMAEHYRVGDEWFARVTTFPADNGRIVYNGKVYGR